MFDVIIVLYNPKVELLKLNVNEILKNNFINKIYIVDNSKKSLSLDFGDHRIVYLPLMTNTGIAKAQNIGLLESLNEKESNAVVLFDQDSILENDLLNKLYGDFNKIKAKYPLDFAALGPQTIDSFNDNEDSSMFSVKMDNLSNISSIREIIASGKMINKEHLLAIGLMDEGLFIDGVDHEWCWRANKMGYKIYISKNAKMVHTLGDSRKRIGPINLRVSSPIRMYYQYRNYFILLKRNYVPFYWKIRNLIGYILKVFVFCFMDEDKDKRRIYICSGIKDGIKGKEGKYNKL